ncbi:MAG TPA: TadE family protein [Acidimicrobiales bacterium]|nr:TadE family protein [Acidimicrobiales bacterium]
MAGERGATLVEAALVMPLLFLLVFGLIDLGLWVFDSTQATAAARDGARVAILDYRAADVPGSADRASVQTAASRHIDVSGPAVAVRCLRGDASLACDQALPGEDRIEVTVSWERETLTFVGDLFGASARQVSATSAMGITGRAVAER